MDEEKVHPPTCKCCNKPTRKMYTYKFNYKFIGFYPKFWVVALSKKITEDKPLTDDVAIWPIFPSHCNFWECLHNAIQLPKKHKAFPQIKLVFEEAMYEPDPDSDRENN